MLENSIPGFQLQENGNDDGGRGSRRGAIALLIGGQLFTNSAAKFWSALLDELHSDFKESDGIVLETLSDTILSRELLFPQALLQREIDACAPIEDVRRSLEEALEEMELTGPPDSVRADVLAGDAVLKRCVLPFDCIDAEVFAFLLAWLLEWAEVPEALWNSDRVNGGFTARDRERGLLYDMRAALVFEHVSEGLFRRILKVNYVISAL